MKISHERGAAMTINEMKQSYKQSYTDNVELSIFNLRA